MEKNKDLGAETETKEKCKEKELIEKCELFKNTNGEVVITSLELARILNMEDKHYKIMDNIKKWVISTNTLKVGVKKYVDNKGEERPYYELDKYAFMLYATHIKGMDELKVKIIKDYEAMEKYIIQTNQEEQFKKFREKLDILEKENDVYNKDSNFYSIRDIRELLGGESIEIDTNKLKEMSYKLKLPVKQEEGYFNSKLTYYNRYHFLVWFGVYKDIFEITSDEKLRIKNAYDELNNLKN